MRPFTPVTRGLPLHRGEICHGPRFPTPFPLVQKNSYEHLLGSPASASSVFGLSLYKPGKSQPRSVIVGDETLSTPAQGLPNVCAICEPMTVCFMLCDRATAYFRKWRVYTGMTFFRARSP